MADKVDRKFTWEIEAVDAASTVFQKVTENAKKEFDKIKQTFGRRSLFGEAAEAFEGKGPLVGLTMIGREIDEASKKAVELAKSLGDSTKPTGEILEELGKGLPVFGSWVEAGRNIRAAIDGSAAAVEKLNAENKVTGLVLDAQRRSIDAAKASFAEYVEFARTKGHEIRNALMPANQRAEDDTDFSIDNDVKKLRERAAADIAKLREANREAIAEARKRPSDENLELIKKVMAGQAAAEGKIRADAEKEAGLATQAIALKFENDRQRLADERSAHVKAEVEKAQKAIADAQTKAQVEYLRSAKQNYQADVVELKQAMEDRLDAIRKELAEEGKLFEKGDKENQDKVKQRAADKSAAAHADYQAGFFKAQAAEQERVVAVDEKIRQAKIAGIEAEVAAGNKAREGELEQLRIADEFNAKRRELVELLKEANAVQKQQIGAELADLDVQQQRASAAAIEKSVTEVLQESKKSSLEFQASQGNRLAEIQLKQLELAIQYREEAAKLQGIIDNTLASDQARVQAAAALAQLQKDTGAAMAKAAQGTPGIAALPSIGQTGPGISGVVQAWKEHAAAAAQAAFFGYAPPPAPGVTPGAAPSNQPREYAPDAFTRAQDPAAMVEAGRKAVADALAQTMIYSSQDVSETTRQYGRVNDALPITNSFLNGAGAINDKSAAPIAALLKDLLNEFKTLSAAITAPAGSFLPP